MSQLPRIVIIGASSMIAEHCARLWLQQHACEIFLVGRNLDKLARIQKDLQIRFAQHSNIHLKTLDFLDQAAIQQCIDDIATQAPIDIALIAQGSLADQQRCQQQLIYFEESLQINALSPLLFAQSLSQHMLAQNHGHLAIIGSVAGDRGRKSNFSYGAAKACVATYMEGLQHHIAVIGAQMHATLIKPGPTLTPMTAQLPNHQGMASPQHVAQDIVKAIQQKKKVLYTPGRWALIMWVIRQLPLFIFKKLDI